MADLDKATARPWRLTEPDAFGDYTIQPPCENLAIAAVVNAASRKMGGKGDETAANAALIVAAVNEREALLKCAETLREIVTDAKTCSDRAAGEFLYGISEWGAEVLAELEKVRNG